MERDQEDAPRQASEADGDPGSTEALGRAPGDALEEKTRAYQEAKDRYLRLYADFENFKKRTQRDQADFMKYAAEKLLKELLPVADNLERAITHARSLKADPTIVDGLDLIARQFQDAIQKSGAEPITAVGQPFDPAVHQALAHVESSDHRPDTVIEEAQRGYLLHGRILRPALVTIAKPPAAG